MWMTRRTSGPSSIGQAAAVGTSLETDAEKYSYQHILVVGGGDSAVEAAVSLGEQPGNRVTLSYRGKDINRPKEDNLKRLQAAVAAQRVRADDHGSRRAGSGGHDGASAQTGSGVQVVPLRT